MTDEQEQQALSASGAQDFSAVPDVAEMQLDLDKGEKLRVTALILASRYYIETICKDGGLYKAMVKDGKTFTPATVESVISIAIQFEMYIRGDFKIEREDTAPSPQERNFDEEET